MTGELGKVCSLDAVSRLDPCWLKPHGKPLCNAKGARAARLDGGQWAVWWDKGHASVYPDAARLLESWDIWV